MNKLICLCREVLSTSNITQRQLSEKLKISVGSVNNLIQEASGLGYLTQGFNNYELTKEGQDFLEGYKVDNAIILSAGFGSRFVPFTYYTPKGLLKVNGTPMIERQIEQLKEKGIDEIIIVVGYLKEAFDYLIDKYGVKLVYNPEYAIKNNFVSLYYAIDYLKSSYILVSDDWMVENMFNQYEPCSWITCVYEEGPSGEWIAKPKAQGKISSMTTGGENGWAMMGPAFFTREYSKTYAKLLVEYYHRSDSDNFYWEQIVRDNLDILPTYINKQDKSNVFEFENLEELRQYDSSYIEETNNEILQEIASIFDVSESSISNIDPLKEGLTNLSFIFSINNDERYVYRLPGVGTEKLIDRSNEKLAYDLLAPYGITDEVIIFDPVTGKRITKFYQDVHISDAKDDTELAVSMGILRRVHDLALQVDNRFDIKVMIEHYQSICDDLDAIRFRDYLDTKMLSQELLRLRDRLAIPEVLCHGDALPANVLIFPDGECRLIDWEYCGMADPIMDVAMYGIFDLFSRERLELSLQLYLGREASDEELVRLYLYVALGGFLWSLWAEYKQALGTELGEYPLHMYRYMKDYYKIIKNSGWLD